MRSNLKSETENIEIIEVEGLEKYGEIAEIENMSQMIDYLVFDINDIKQFKIVFEKHKQEIIKQFKKNDKALSLVEKYIDYAKDEKISVHQLINMSKTISYIINSTSINIGPEERKEILKTLNNTQSRLSPKHYSSAERKRINKYINLLKESIKKQNPKNNQLNNLNYKYGISDTFSRQVIDELNNVVKSYDKPYVDLRNKYIFTIDTSKNCCYEDAMSFEKLPNGNYLLGVYIIDVYSYIQPEGLLEMEAFNRGRTIYLPGLNLPMFPEELVFNYLTLVKNKTKCVIANLFEFSPSFDLVNYDIKRAIVNIKDNKAYKEVEADLSAGKSILENDLFDKLLLLVNKIKQSNPSVKNYHTKKENNSCYSKNQSQIIEYLMIYTNQLNAEKYSKTQYPFLYRVNLDRYDYFKNLKIDTNSGTVQNVIDELKNIPNSSFYSTENKGHFGLNLKIYAHTTTPARNFAALQNQKLVQKIIIDKEQLTDAEVYNLKDKLDIISQALNEKDKIINGYTEEYMYLKRRKKI